MSTATIDRTEDTDVVEPITDTITGPETGTEGVEVDGETTPSEPPAPPVVRLGDPDQFGSSDLAAEYAQLKKDAVDLLRDQILGDADRDFALGYRVWKLCEFQRKHAPKFEDEDLIRVCNSVWDEVSLEISLPKKNHLDRCVAFYLFRQTAIDQFKLDPIPPKPKKGKRDKPVLPYTVFDRHIYPAALEFDAGGLGLEVKVKWFAWLRSLLVDILDSGKKFSRSALDDLVAAERKRQRDEGKSEDQLEREKDRADRTARKAKRETIKSSLSKAVDASVKGDLLTASQMVTELVNACQAAEMPNVPAIGGVDPVSMRPEDADSMVAVLSHFRRTDVMLRLHERLSAEIAKIQGS